MRARLPKSLPSSHFPQNVVRHLLERRWKHDPRLKCAVRILFVDNWTLARKEKCVIHLSEHFRQLFVRTRKKELKSESERGTTRNLRSNWLCMSRDVVVLCYMFSARQQKREYSANLESENQLFICRRRRRTCIDFAVRAKNEEVKERKRGDEKWERGRQPASLQFHFSAVSFMYCRVIIHRYLWCWPLLWLSEKITPSRHLDGQARWGVL